MNISIFGLGYVGCVSMGCLAQSGHKVIGIDVSEVKVKLINQGKATIIEPGLDGIINEQWKNGRISATKDYLRAVCDTDVSIVCVGTPSTNEGHVNLEYIYKTAKEIGEGLRDKTGFHVIVLRSTVLPGTNLKVNGIIEQASGKSRNEHFAVVSNPEFLREGSAVNDYWNPPVTVMGSDNQKAIAILKEIYKDINAPIEETDIAVAEMIKYVNNSFHALKVSFANEVGNICKKLDIDSHKVMELFCKDKHLNLSSYYFKPGFSYGGSCLPKDLKALKMIAHDNYLCSPIIDSIASSNENQKKIAFEMIVKEDKKNVGILGLSFKKGTDDLRYSPFVELAEQLLGKGFNILIHDKEVNLSNVSGTNKEYIDKHIPHLSKLLSNDLSHVIGASDILVISKTEKEYTEIIDKYPDKMFIDLVRTGSRRTGANYKGICW